MENLTSDTRKYKCICKKSLISAKDLKEHIRKPKRHSIIFFMPEKVTTRLKRYLVQRRKTIKLSRSKSIWSWTYLSQDIYYKFLDHMATLQKNSKLDKTLVSIENPDQYDKNTKNNKSYACFLILNKLNNQGLKEISVFKLLKQKANLNFNRFFGNRIQSIYLLCLSSDGRVLISGGYDGKVRCWNPKTLDQTACLSYHKSYIWALDIDSSSNYALSGSGDCSICLWNINEKKIKRVFMGHRAHVNTIKFINSNDFISGSDDKTIRIWNIFKPSLIYVISTYSLIKFVSFEIEIQRFVFVCEDGRILNFNLNKQNPFKKSFFKAGVNCSCLAEVNKILITGHIDGWVQFINLNTLCLLSSSKAHLDKVNSINFCEKFIIIASCSDDFSIKLWDSKSFQVKKSFTHFRNKIICVQISNKNLYFGGHDCQIECINILSSKTIATTKLNKIDQNCLCVSIKLNLIVYGFDKIYFFCLKLLKNIKLIDLGCEIRSLSLFKSILLCGTLRGEIFFVDCTDLRIKRRFLFGKSIIYFVCLSRDLKVLCFSTENNSKMINLSSSKSLLELQHRIVSGKFSKTCFVFMDWKCDVFVYDKFNKLLKIGRTYGIQFYFCKDFDFLLFKDFLSRYSLINLRNERISKSFEKLKVLFATERNLRICKESLLLLLIHKLII